MALLRLIGAIATIVGSILLVLDVIIKLCGFDVEAWLAGLTGLVLGVGIIVYMIPDLIKKS